MTLENTPSSPSNIRENVTEGYLSQPRSILKLRENSTVPINTSQSERRVSFFNQVELRQFESTVGSSEENEAFTDPPEYFSSELDEHPGDNLSNEHRKEQGDRDAIFEDVMESTVSTANDEETMELTGQLSAPPLRIASPVHTDTLSSAHMGASNDQIPIFHSPKSPAAPLSSDELKPALVETQSSPAAVSKSPPTKISTRLSTTPSRRSLEPQVDRNDTTNISFTTSPYQERQVLLLPTMNHEATLENLQSNVVHGSDPSNTEFRPIEALQEYADSLRDSLFNDPINLPLHGEDAPKPVLNDLTLQAGVSEEDVDMDLTVPQNALDTYDEVTMDLTTRVTNFVPNTISAGEDISQNNEETMEFTQPIRTPANEAPVPIGTSTQDELPKLQPVTEDTDINTQNLEQPLNDSSSQVSQSHDEATMELTEVHLPAEEKESHMLSVVQEEEEVTEETEVPMDLTKPIAPDASNVKTPVPSGGSTPPGRKSYGQEFLNGVEDVVDGSLVERTGAIGSVDTPALMAAQKQFHRLIENSTPPYSRNRLSIGALGTPMHDPPPVHRLEYTKLPGDDQGRRTDPKSDRLDFELSAEPEVRTAPAKRSLDPAIELKSSPSKKPALESPMPSAATDLPQLNIPKVSLSKFLDEIDVKFFDDLDFATELFTEGGHANDSNTNYLKEDYYKANIHVSLLEVYELSCKELKGKIEQGKKLYEELQETAEQEVPDLFTKYYQKSYYEQMDIKSKFQTIREYTREQAKQVWYEWRSKLFQNVIEVLHLNLEVLKEDKLTLKLNIQELANEYQQLQEKLADIKHSIALFKQIKEHYRNVPPEQIAKIKTDLAALNSQLLEHQEAIRKEYEILETINKEIDSQRVAIAETRGKVDDANHELLKLKHFEPAEIENLKVTSSIIQACAGLKFIESPSKNIFEFEFNPKMGITVDISKTNSADGLVFHPIDSDQKILYNDSLERYCQALAESTPFLNIFETLSVFRQKWLRLLSIDEQIYALSIFYPIEIETFNENAISFKLQFYSGSSGLKVDYMVKIPLQNILYYQSSVLVTAKILKSRLEASAQTVREAICQQRATHRLFENVGDIELVT